MGISFFILGILVLGIGIWLRIRAKHQHNHEGEEGSVGLILGGFFLIAFYGLFYAFLLNE